MPWNQPGSDNRDPWGQGNGQKGPPDLDEVIRDLQKKLGGLFGGRGSGRRSGGLQASIPLSPKIMTSRTCSMVSPTSATRLHAPGSSGRLPSTLLRTHSAPARVLPAPRPRKPGRTNMRFSSPVSGLSGLNPRHPIGLSCSVHTKKIPSDASNDSESSSWM